jgi:ketosteroid isomerase-like protein
VSDPREHLIREGFEASNRGDREAALEAIDPDVEIVTETQAGAPTHYHGHEGYRAWNSGWYDVWTDVRWEVAEEIEQHGDHFLVEVTTWGKGRGSGIELSQTLTWIFTIPEGGKPNRIHLVRTREAAVEAIRA